MKIAIIGSGISGLACAWLLNKEYDITLFEKNDYIGGHSNTAVIQYDKEKIAVDSGFIVFNFRTYPNLKAFFELLGVEIVKSNMSFGVKHLNNNMEYCASNIAGLFAQKKNLFNPKFLKMLKDILKFNKKAINFIENKLDLENKTLNEFIADLRLGDYFKNYYLFPMAAAIWSCPLELIKDYPAKTFLQFFYNHGLLSVKNQPQWYTVKGGSKQYVKKVISDFSDKIRLNCEIIRSKKVANKLILTDNKNNDYAFDEVIFANHSDEIYKIIADKTHLEEVVLRNIKYSKNSAFLHKDEKQMPDNKNAWASWVYLANQKTNQVSLNYWMNNLQNIDKSKPLFVTLNPINKIKESDIFARYEYQHPIFDDKAIKSQTELDKIQGKRNIWFCGAWTKYGFHEDGLNSAINIANKFKIKIPWKN